MMELSESEDKAKSRRKSSRPRKRAKTYSPEPGDDPQKKKKIRKTQPNRPFDLLPSGEPFCCSLCKSPYVVNTKGSKKLLKSRHTPLPRIRIDEQTGKEIQLCNACAQSFDKPRHKPRKPEVVPTEEELEAYLNEAKLFTKGLRAELDVPHVDRLFCPVSKKKLCGCLQRYIKAEMQVSGVSCIENFVSLMKEAEELRKEKVYSLTDIKAKPKKSVGLGNGHKKSKRYEQFVMTKRQYLKEDMRLCERATQRILMYSNNFLHKKLKTEERPCRIERTRGKIALGKLPAIHTLVDMVCCTENCVMMALTHRKLLQSWRERSKLGQLETRRVLAEMLTPAGANHRNCYHFIGYVTGCSPSTIGRVYNMMMESSGNREPPEHGMKRVWQENYKQNKVVSREGEKSMNDEGALVNKKQMMSDSRSSQKPSKTNVERIVAEATESSVQMQCELQKQQLARIQMDLLEKQQQLEQQQANLQQQMLAQQASSHSDASQMNQAVVQQILEQFAQQQQQQQQHQYQATQITPEYMKTVASQPEIPVNQSVQIGNMSQTQSVLKQPVFQVVSVNYVNGEIQLVLAGLDQVVNQNGMQPGQINFAEQSVKNAQGGNQVSSENEISNLNPVNMNSQSTVNIQSNQTLSQPLEMNSLNGQIQLPYDFPVSSGNCVNLNLGSTVDNLPQNEIHNIVVAGNQPSTISENTGTRIQIHTSDPANVSSNNSTESLSISNNVEQDERTVIQTGSCGPNYRIVNFVQNMPENPTGKNVQPIFYQNMEFQGHMTLSGIPVQITDSSGQQYGIITGQVQNQNQRIMLSQEKPVNQTPVVNMEVPVVRHDKVQGSLKDESYSGTLGTVYNIVTNSAPPQTATITNVVNENSLNNSSLPHIHQYTITDRPNNVPNVQVEDENQPAQVHVSFVNIDPKNIDSGSQQFSQNSVVSLPMYETRELKKGGLSGETSVEDSSKSSFSDKNSQPKRNVQFKNIQDPSIAQESNLTIKDVTFVSEENLVNPDMVLPPPNSQSQSRHSSGNSTRSRHPSGSTTKFRHSSGNSSLNIDSFKQLSNSFKLKDFNKSGNTVNVNRSRMSSGDCSRQSNGNRSRQTSGERSRQSSGERSRQPSGNRSRQPSGNSLFSEYSNLTNMSPNLFLSKNMSFLQGIDSISGVLEDMQSPDFAMFNSSPTNTGGATLPEITLTESGRVEFDNSFINTPFLSHDSSRGEADVIGHVKDQSTSDTVGNVGPTLSVIAVLPTEPNGQKALKNPVLNSILSRPPKYISG